ncbi:TPA: amino acid permease [Salmonella enterica subsp. enterica serovar Thompson]
MSNTNSGLLGIKDIVFMNVIAILSLRQIPNVAPYGASAMLLWVIAAFCLFFPLAMVCGELSTGWPKDGGIFVWIKEAFGKRIAWIVVVCFLFSCVLFFPLMLQFGFTALGFLSIAFAVALLFIPPSQIDMGGYFQYAGKIIGGAVLAVVVAEYIYHRAQKRNARLSMAGGK